MRLKNTYELVAVNTVLVDIGTKQHPTAEMLIYLEDWEMLLAMGIGRVCCHRLKDHNVSYAKCHINGKQHQVHRLLRPEFPKVDHINRCGTDNRTSNLRDGSNGINERNCKKYSTNTSGVTGVSFDGRGGRWRANIRTNGKQIGLGYFDTIEEAASVRKAAEVQFKYEND